MTNTQKLLTKLAKANGKLLGKRRHYSDAELAVLLEATERLTALQSIMDTRDSLGRFAPPKQSSPTAMKLAYPNAKPPRNALPARFLKGVKPRNALRDLMLGKTAKSNRK